MGTGKSRFSRYEVNGEGVRRYEVFDVVMNDDGTLPTLFGKVAGDGNPAFVAALVKVGEPRLEKIKAVGDDEDALKAIERQTRKEDAEMYFDHVITAWEHFQDDDGNEVELSKEAFVECASSLPNAVWRGIVGFFGNYENFTNGALSRAEAAEVGNESARR